MARYAVKHFSEPDDVRPFAGHGEMKLLEFSENQNIGLARFDPGWKWSQDLKPIAQTDSCEMSHAGFVISGRMHLKMDSGEEFDVGAGDVFLVEPGHDAWVVGDETCVILDWQGFGHYAERGAGQVSRREHEAQAPAYH